MIELQRQKKILRMMMTAHSILRDRYLFLSSFFEITLLVASVILNVVVFIDEQYIFRITGVNGDIQKLIAGLSSIIVFAISVVLLQVRWKERAENHSKALDQLFELLQACRIISNLEGTSAIEDSIAIFNLKYINVFNSIVRIPEKKFNSLKLKHSRKVELSKMIDRYPQSRLFILKIKMFLSSFKEKRN
jgi:hypothetical protein